MQTPVIRDDIGMQPREAERGRKNKEKTKKKNKEHGRAVAPGRRVDVEVVVHGDGLGDRALGLAHAVLRPPPRGLAGRWSSGSTRSPWLTPTSVKLTMFEPLSDPRLGPFFCETSRSLNAPSPEQLPRPPRPCAYTSTSHRRQKKKRDGLFCRSERVCS